MRLFLAADPDPGARRELERLQAALRAPGDGWRWVRVASVHLTLRFLGEVDPATLEQGRRCWGAAAAGLARFRVRVAGLGCFPSRSRPRVLWVGLVEVSREGRLPRLAAALESASRAVGLAPESRAFRPHLTLARAARGGRPRPPRAAEFDGGGFELREVILYRSELGPDGARYTPLASFPLGEPAGEHR